MRKWTVVWEDLLLPVPSATLKAWGVPQEIRAASIKEAYQLLCAYLRVEGPRALTAVDPAGRIVRASLYEGDNYSVDKRGRRREW